MIGSVKRWRSWAEAIRARHTRQLTRGEEHGMTYRSSPVVAARTGAAMTVSHPLQFLFAPKLTFTYTTATAAVRPQVAPPQIVNVRKLEQASSTPVPPLARVYRLANPAAPLTLKLACQKSGTEAASLAVHRLLRVEATRTERILGATRLTLPAVGEAIESVERIRRIRREEMRVEPAPRVLPRATAATPSQTTATPFATPEDWPPRREHRPSSQATQPAPPPMPSIDSLTSQVIDQIDRRLVAYRERMGRI